VQGGGKLLLHVGTVAADDHVEHGLSSARPRRALAPREFPAGSPDRRAAPCMYQGGGRLASMVHERPPFSKDPG
jgi:hypothetical protein